MLSYHGLVIGLLVTMHSFQKAMYAFCLREAS